MRLIWAARLAGSFGRSLMESIAAELIRASFFSGNTWLSKDRLVHFVRLCDGARSHGKHLSQHLVLRLHFCQKLLGNAAVVCQYRACFANKAFNCSFFRKDNVNAILTAVCR